MLLDILNIGSKLIDKIFPDKIQAEQAKIKLMELQQAGEFKQLDMELEREKLEQSDRASARMREQIIAQSGKRDLVPPLLAILLTVGFFGLLILIINFDVDREAMQLLDIMLGSLGTGFTMMLSYYFGSSSGSQKKDTTIDRIVENIKTREH